MHEVLGREELILVIDAINFKMNDYNINSVEHEILYYAKQKLEINYQQLMEMLGRKLK
jgi:hypothetical protein